MDALTFLLNPRHDLQSAQGYEPIFDNECRRTMHGALEDMRYDVESITIKLEKEVKN